MCTLRYQIRDLEGALKATHVRHEYDDGTKSMPWDPAGVKPAELPLYGINRTYDTADSDIIIVCEGEKATDSLWERGILAAGTVTGAAKIPCDDSLRSLLRFKVLLWPDADPPGRSHMDAIAARLFELGAKELWRIYWPEAPLHGDAADCTNDIEVLIRNAVPIPRSSKQAAQDPDDDPVAIGPGVLAQLQYTDAWLAGRFILTHPDEFCFRQSIREWQRWTGEYWHERHAGRGQSPHHRRQRQVL